MIEKEKVEVARLGRGQKITTYKHTGFDFAGDAGHDKLITDSVMNRM